MTIHLTLDLLLALAIVALPAMFYAVWVHYLAVMHLKQVQEQHQQAGGLKPGARLLGYGAVLPVGVALDWLLNVALSFFPFVDPPRSLGELVTGRLQRYVSADPALTTWRARIAWAMAHELLNDFDRPHGHITRLAPLAEPVPGPAPTPTP